MKSALANVGKTQLSATAASLEQAGRDKMAAHIRTETTRFLEDLRDVVTSLSPKEEESVADASLEDTSYLHAGLEKIRDACEIYNKKAARTALENLKTKTWTKETKTLLDNIAANLLHSAFEEASEEITKFLG
jgi:HPt (histidine-containing phosphotransfer) domain-containing protein